VSIPRALLLVLALLQAAGIVDLVRRETCEAECERNGCTDCTPGDDGPSCSCHCASAPTIKPASVATTALLPIGEPVARVLAGGDRMHLSPDPREILHVPRRAV
jgi:hypothetical protein